MAEIKRKQPEVLAPAGDLERLEAALLYGADAVYLAGKAYGMRSASRNFDEDGLADAVRLAHERGRKVYVTCNTLPHNAEMDRLPAFLQAVQAAGADALIVCDLGLMAMAARYAPDCRLHVSTQFGVMNYQTARTLWEYGASRVVLARELPLEEIAVIREKTPPSLELECFVHGAMCASVSGRCFLSSYLAGRDANHGDCAQPCRWKYRLAPDSLPEHVLTAEEYAQGTYLFNAHDLCMIEQIPALVRAGVSSFKIEGRAKAAYYAAVTANAYKSAVTAYMASPDPDSYRVPAWIRRELDTISHRPYGTGFFFGTPQQNTAFGGYIQHYEVAAVVEGWSEGRLFVSQRNYFQQGDALEVLEPGKPPVSLPAAELLDAGGEPIAAARHPKMALSLYSDRAFLPGSFIRRRVPDEK